MTLQCKNNCHLWVDEPRQMNLHCILAGAQGQVSFTGRGGHHSLRGQRPGKTKSGRNVKVNIWGEKQTVCQCMWDIIFFKTVVNGYYSLNFIMHTVKCLHTFLDFVCILITVFKKKNGLDTPFQPLRHAPSDQDCFACLISVYSSCSTYRMKDISFLQSWLEIRVCPPCLSLPAPNLYKHKPYHRHLQLSVCFTKPEDC